MNIFNSVTLNSLKKNKTRTLVTIIGIILSAAMFTAVVTFIGSLQKYMMDVSVYQSGDWHVSTASIDSDEIASLKQNGKISQISVSQNIGYSYLNDSENPDKPYLYIIGADKSFTENLPVHLASGSMPTNSNEIILPIHLRQIGGIYYSIGDVLDLSIGQRVSGDGTVLNQSNPYLPGVEEGSDKENFVADQTRSYTVVGFYERPEFESYTAPGFTAITVMDDTVAPSYTFDAFFKINDIDDAYSFGTSIAQEFDCSVNMNQDVLMFSGASQYDNFYRVLYTFAGILIAMIMLGAISLIYNAFSISVSDRTKQFGLLSSIGATKRQIRRSVVFEALFVSIIGIPLGVISGIAGIGVTLACLGDAFSSLYVGRNPISLGVHVNVWIILISVVIALITVLISAYIPAKRATQISAIEAIRQSKDISLKGKSVKTSKLTYRIFGLESMIASKHFKRDRKKYRATVISLIMSIILFITASTYCSYLKGSVNTVFTPNDYDIIYYMEHDGSTEDKGLASKLYNVLKNIQGVEMSTLGYMSSVGVEFPKELLTDEYAASLSDDEGENGDPKKAVVYAVDDETFINFLEKNNLDKSLYLNPEAPLAIATNSTKSFNSVTEKYESFTVFKKTSDIAFNLLVFNEEVYDTLSDAEKNATKDPTNFMIDTPVKIGSFFDKLPLGVDANNDGASIAIMYPESMINYVSPKLYGEYATMYFKATDYNNVYDKMSSALFENSLDASKLTNIAASSETDRNIVMIIDVFSYGFIILISLIAVANVFNTISTNINLRRREFAMLKSVGMTQKGFNKMMNFECLLYGFKSLLWGLPISFGLTYFMYRGMVKGVSTSFIVPWVSVGIAILSVFVVVFSTMMYSMSKIKKDNPIEALRL